MLLTQNLNTIQSGAFPKSSSLEQTTIGGIITNLLPYIFGAAAIALLIYLILGGFQLMTSQGDPKAAQSAQGKITNAIIGFVIIILAFFIVQLAGQLLGIKGTIFGNIFGAN